MSDSVSGFDNLVHALGGGEAIVELNRLQRELLERNASVAGEHGIAKASLSLKISFVTDKNGQTEIGYSVDGKSPSVPTTKTTLYATKGGGLSTQDPRQKRLPFAKPRIVEAPAGGDQ